jgi:hypothetical protein
MDDRDAFGRRTEEDPLSEMGWSAEATTSAESTETAERSMPADTSVPAEKVERRMLGGAVPGPSLPGSPRTIRGPAALGCLVAVVAVVGVIAAGAVFVVGAVDDASDTVESVFPTVVDEPPPADDRPSEPPAGLARGSMLLRGNLAPALQRMRREMGGRLRYVRIEAERVDTQVTRRGRLVSAQARWDAEPQVFQGGQSPAGPTFVWSQVDPSAPRRFVDAITRKAGRPSSAFDYAVLSASAPGLEWQAFLEGGTHYAVSRDGRRVTRR